MTDALLFWLLAAAMTVLALAFVLPRLLTRGDPRARIDRAALNAAIGRGELAEIDRARADARLDERNYALARLEIERRLLGDVIEEPEPGATRMSSRAIAFGIAIVLPALAFALYALIGEPPAHDAGDRATPHVASDGGAASVQRDALVRHLARHPDDARSRVLLARIDFDADRFAEAAASYEQAIAASPKVAADPTILCEFADALGMVQGGTLAGRPLELVRRALALDPEHPNALEMAGSAAYEQRDYAEAVRLWRQLLAQLAPSSPEHRDLAIALAGAERMQAAAASLGAARPSAAGPPQGARPLDDGGGARSRAATSLGEAAL